MVLGAGKPIADISMVPAVDTDMLTANMSINRHTYCITARV